MPYIVSYVAALIVFGILDAIWLTTMASWLYRPALGDILLDNLRFAPALAEGEGNAIADRGQGLRGGAGLRGGCRGVGG